MRVSAPPGRRFELPGQLTGAVPDGGGVQLAFEDLGTPLSEVTFVIVDLETTGARSAGSQITEIGAVKVRGGETLGEFSTLVRPDGAIPAFITSLTGISNAMVQAAPPLPAVFPAFLEFAGLDRGHVLVAHNAGFDVSFLKAASKELGHPWPGPRVVDTLWLARRVVTKSEAPNHKLATLAAHFGSPTTPTHRALDDAKATVHVLHALLERVGPLGITHAEDLTTISDPVPQRRRRRATLADDLPDGPGVYLFHGPGGEVLYVGTARNLRRRVRTYFTKSETRRRIGEMVDLAARVSSVSTSGDLEAKVRELRLIATHDPPYNVRSKRPDRACFLTLTEEAYPRLVVTKNLPATAQAAWGPFPSRVLAERAREIVMRATGLRSCTTRLPLRPRAGATACLAKELGTCCAPCVDPAAGAGYARSLERGRRILAGHFAPVGDYGRARLIALSDAQRFEEAAGERDRIAAAVYGARRFERLLPYLTTPELIAARPNEDRSWELIIVRYGRLASSVRLPRGKPLAPYLDAARAAAETVPAPARLGAAASAEETALIAAWCEGPGVRFGEIVPGPTPFAFPTTSVHRPSFDLERITAART